MLNSLLSKYRLRSKIYATALHMEDGSVTHAQMISDLAVELDEAADELQNYIFPRLDEKYHKILNILMIEYIRAQNWYIGSDIAYIAKPTIRNYELCVYYENKFDIASKSVDDLLLMVKE